MIIISHRGLLEGPNDTIENMPWAIDIAIQTCGHVEVDIWNVNGRLFLGHDKPKTEINNKWLHERASNLWIHCKNTDAVSMFNEMSDIYHYFWHQNDTLTLTSRKFIWAFPGKQPIKNSIAVLPEIYNENISQCLGICTDVVYHYQKFTEMSRYDTQGK